MRESFYTAIDIGNSKVLSIVSRIGPEGDLKILGTGVVASQGMQKSRVENLDAVKTAVGMSLDDAQRYIGRGVITGSYVSVSGTHTRCLNTKQILNNPGNDGDVTPKSLEELIQATVPEVGPTEELLHIIPIGYEVDGLTAVRNPSGLHAQEINVESHVVVAEASALTNTVRAVEANKFSVSSLVLGSIASAETTLTADEKEMGVVLVDIGGGVTDMVIYRQGSPWYSCVIPVGGNQMTRDLAVSMRVPYYLAEEIKVKWGHAMPKMVHPDEDVVVPSFQGQPKRIVKRQSLCEPLYERQLELLKLVLLRLRQSGLRQIPIGGLVITGGCAEMPGIQELVIKTLGGPARIAYPTGIAGLPSQLQKPSMSTGVGLLLWGIKHQGERRTYRNGDRPAKRQKNDDMSAKPHQSLRERLWGGHRKEQKVTVE